MNSESGRGARAAAATLRAAAPADAPALAALLAEVQPGAWSEARLSAELARLDALVVVAEVGGPPASAVLARLVGDELSVLDVATAPAARRQGLARTVLAYLLERAGALGARTAHLELRESNAAALALYRSAGFVVVGRRPRYYPGGEAATLMTRTLREAGAEARAEGARVATGETPT